MRTGLCGVSAVVFASLSAGCAAPDYLERPEITSEVTTGRFGR